MVLRGFRWAYRRFGRRYVRGSLFVLHLIAFAIVLGGIGLLTIYQPLGEDFWSVVGLAEGLLAIETAFALAFATRMTCPADAWLSGAASGRPSRSTRPSPARRPEPGPAALASKCSRGPSWTPFVSAATSRGSRHAPDARYQGRTRPARI